jgi:hypothetical protein
VTAEVPALHRAGKTFTDRDALNVNELTGNEVLSTLSSAPTSRTFSLSSTRNSTTFFFGSTFAFAKWPRIALDVRFTFALPNAELNGRIAVLALRSWHADDLAVVDLQHGHGNLTSRLPSKMRVMPSLRAITPVLIVFFLTLIPKEPSTYAAWPSDFDLNIYTGRQIEFHQRIDRLRRRIDDIDQTLVRAHFELFLRAFLSTCGERLTVNF